MVPVPASIGPLGYDVGRRFQGAHVSMAKMDPNAPNAANGPNGYVHDAKRHARQ